MSLALTKRRTFYAATAGFCAVVVAAILAQQAWLLLVPLLALFYVWTFEKPHILFYILLAAIPWSVEFQLTQTIGTDFPDEPLMWLVAATVLFFIAYQRKTGFKALLQHPILILLVLQFFWSVLTIVTSTQPLLSLKFVLAKSWYLLAFVGAPLLFLQTKSRLRTATIVLTASMVLLVAVTQVRHAAAGFTFAEINNSLAPFFRNHVNYSALLVCIIPVLVALVAGAKTRIVKIVFYLAIALCLLALFLSYARGAWLALFTGAVGYGLLKKKWLLPAFFLTILVTVSIAFWLQHNNRYLTYAHNYNKTIFHTNFAEHLTATYEFKDMSTAERFYRWVAGARMVKAAWQTGFGPNTFYNNYKPYAVPAFKTWVSTNEEHSTVHNYFLLLLIEQGAPGLFLFLCLLAVAFYKAQRLYHTTKDAFWKPAIAVAAVLLVMICTVNFLSDLIETDKIGSVFYLCLAILMLAEKGLPKEHLQAAAHV